MLLYFTSILWIFEIDKEDTIESRVVHLLTTSLLKMGSFLLAYFQFRTINNVQDAKLIFSRKLSFKPLF